MNHMETEEQNHNAHDIKVDGTEQTVADEMKAAFGGVEHTVGQVLGDELMDQAGDTKIVDHGSIQDVAEAIEDHAEAVEEQ